MLPLLLLAAVLGGPRPAAAVISGPEDWKRSTVNGLTVLTPLGLLAGETLSVAVYPPEDLSGRPLEAWVTAHAAADPAAPAESPASPQPAAAPANTPEIRACSRLFPAAPGRPPLVGTYLGVVTSGRVVRLVRILTSLPAGALLARYRVGTKAIFGEIGENDRQLFRRWTQRDVGIADRLNRHPLTRGLRPGGELVYGVYGLVTVGSDNTPLTRRLELYPDGGWRLGSVGAGGPPGTPDGGTDQGPADGRAGGVNEQHGDYTYDPVSGRLDLNGVGDLRNGNFGTDAFFLFFREARDAPLIYGERDHGLWVNRSAGHLTGPTTRPSPLEEEKTARRQAEK